MPNKYDPTQCNVKLPDGTVIFNVDKIPDRKLAIIFGRTEVLSLIYDRNSDKKNTTPRIHKQLELQLEENKQSDGIPQIDEKKMFGKNLRGQTIEISEFIRAKFDSIESDLNKQMVLYRQLYATIKQKCGNGKENTKLLTEKLSEDKPVTYKELSIGTERSIGAFIHHFGIERVWKVIKTYNF